jgi:uracil phosphoribosyltransferase
MSTSSVNVVAHPLVQHKLSLMREKDRSTKSFREILNEIGMLLGYEVTRDLPLELVEIETPISPMRAPKIAGKKLTLAPILRAGVGFLDGMLALMPSARIAHIGLYRDPETLQAVEYYFKAPQDLSDRTVILMDPMLATGNSACATSASSAFWPRPRALRNSRASTPTCRSGPPRSMNGSTTTATSCQAWAMPATGCSAPSRQVCAIELLRLPCTPTMFHCIR